MRQFLSDQQPNFAGIGADYAVVDISTTGRLARLGKLCWVCDACFAVGATAL
jgi:hypothetical protein